MEIPVKVIRQGANSELAPGFLQGEFFPFLVLSRHTNVLCQHDSEVSHNEEHFADSGQASQLHFI